MSQKTKGTKRASKQKPARKALEGALAKAIQEIGTLIETCTDPADLRCASYVLRSLAYIAALQWNARTHRVRGRVDKAARPELLIERVYAELPNEVKW